MTDEFLSTPSARRATESGLRCAGGFPYFYPRPLRGGRPPYGIDYQSGRKISIHALCEEGDRGCGGHQRPGSGFLSTPSARRATPYPLALAVAEVISIHALCEEGDGKRGAAGRKEDHFYPRPLRGGRLRMTSRWNKSVGISIHALCEEGDSCALPLCLPVRYFYPRPLRGGRPDSVDDEKTALLFLSTPSARRATKGKEIIRRQCEISIHALCEEGDHRFRPR